jgi:hypothetical protein
MKVDQALQLVVVVVVVVVIVDYYCYFYYYGDGGGDDDDARIVKLEMHNDYKLNIIASYFRRYSYYLNGNIV